ncbi:MAG: hypothetical protein EA420_00435 [Candidatus Competibacteraceae bacterium]|nr:MAG: hypothetical protein EA420_00435 [Candidatus Competibacteraceae bacterium]
MQPGAVIVSVHGEGFARRVAGVRTVNGSLVVETFPATLEDVIQEGVIVYSQTLRRADLVQAMPAPGVRVLEPLSVKDWGVTLELEIDTEELSAELWPKDRPQLTGFIKVTLTPDFALDMGRLFGINELRTAMVVKVETNLDVDLSQTEKFELGPIYPLRRFPAKPLPTSHSHAPAWECRSGRSRGPRCRSIAMAKAPTLEHGSQVGSFHFWKSP